MSRGRKRARAASMGKSEGRSEWKVLCASAAAAYAISGRLPYEKRDAAASLQWRPRCCHAARRRHGASLQGATRIKTARRLFFGFRHDPPLRALSPWLLLSPRFAGALWARGAASVRLARSEVQAPNARYCHVCIFHFSCMFLFSVGECAVRPPPSPPRGRGHPRQPHNATWSRAFVRQYGARHTKEQAARLVSNV